MNLELQPRYYPYCREHDEFSHISLYFQIKRLLAQDRTKRLGALKNGADDVKRHRWFRSAVADWDEVARRGLRPPIVPSVAHDGDTSCYDRYDEIDWRRAPTVTDRERRMFEDF